MRNELVTQAVVSVRNRFLLVHVAGILTRKFHRRGKDRVQESINSSLVGIGNGKYIVASRFSPNTGELTATMVLAGVLDMGTLAGFTSLTTGLPYFPPTEDEPTPEERMAVCSALLNVSDEVVETA